MDNLGDWLYIIIIIVAGISSLFSSLKKKKHPTEVLGQPDYEENSEPPANQKSFWEIFEEELKGSPGIEPLPTPPPIPVVRKEKPVFEKRQIKDVKRKPVPSTPVLLETQEEENSLFNEESFHNPEELRKAIIYAEIFNRKY